MRAKKPKDIVKLTRLVIEILMAITDPSSVPGVTLNAAEFAVGKVAEIYNNHNRESVEQLCNKYLPECEENIKYILIAAIEICLDDVDLNKTAYNAELVSKKYSREYLLKHKSQFSEDEIEFLSHNLPILLEEAIYNIQLEYEENPDFQIKWKARTESEIKGLHTDLEQQKKIIENHEKRISYQEERRILYGIKEWLKEYKEKWNESLFLDDDVKLSDVYQVPHYSKMNIIEDGEEYEDMENLLQETITQCNDLEKRMLVVLGQPGSGKSTLITYILNNCTISSDRAIRVFRFSGIEIDWKRKVENLPQQILRECGMEIKDLSDSVLILDGLDEVDMEDRQAEFLEYLKKLWASNDQITRFTLIVTCRSTRIANPREVSARSIELEPLDKIQVENFSASYFDTKGREYEPNIPDAYFSEDDSIREIVGIPLILYMTLALGIDVDRNSTLCKVYNQIFSLEEQSIYFRSKYDSKHEITAREAERIHAFSKRVATHIWCNNPSEASIQKNSYEKIAKEICKEEDNPDTRSLLIGQYFMEGAGGTELYFVHRSIFEYFVALSIFDEMKEIQLLDCFPEKIFQRDEQNTEYPECFENYASITGFQAITDYPEIAQYLSDLMKGSNFSTRKWKWFLAIFLKEGFVDVVYNRKHGGEVGVREEANRFHNLIWIVREICLNSDDEEAPFNLADGLPHSFYFFFPFEGLLDLSLLSLPELRIINSGFDHAYFSEAYLEYAELDGLDLTESNFEECDLSHSKLYKSNLSGSNLSGADLSYADLKFADLSRTDLSGANLSHADLSMAKLDGANLSGAVMENTVLRGAGLKGVEFSGAEMNDIDFEGEVLDGADFSGVRMGNISFQNSNLINTKFTDAMIKNSNFGNAHINGCDFDNAEMENVNMSTVDAEALSMTSARLASCIVYHSDLSSANLQNTVIESTNLRYTRLSNAVFSGAKLDNVDLQNSFLLYADFTNTNIIDVVATEGGFEQVIGLSQQMRNNIRFKDNDFAVRSNQSVPPMEDDSSIEEIDPEDDYWILNNWNSLDPFYRRYSNWDY